MAARTAITPTRAENYPEWYQQVVREADMAENSEARGCMIIKPWGYGLWQNMQRVLDDMFKEKGVKNAYFPLFIPLRLLAKEAEHVDGFAKECAVVTHHRLEADGKGGLKPAGELEEPYIVRPTSETIIGEAFARWIGSYRDLPLLINQWANVVRWELRTRLFLRTTEFLWQEGHTVHSTPEEADAFSLEMLDVYADFHENWLAVPVIKGRKTPGERFPGAVETYTIEAMMQDLKALQAGTSHFLGQNFAKAANMQFQNEAGQATVPNTTSWGVSTRMVGGMIMTHADDDGMIMPPRVAPAHIVLLPIWKTDEDKAKVIGFCEDLKKQLRQVAYHGRVMDVELDARDIGNGPRKWEWVKKGIPARVEIGAREVESGELTVVMRNRPMDKVAVKAASLAQQLPQLLDTMQREMFEKAKQIREENTREIKTKEDFIKFFDGKGGFALAYWAGSTADEDDVKSKLGVTTRCIPFDKQAGNGVCVWTGKPATQRVIFAKAY